MDNSILKYMVDIINNLDSIVFIKRDQLINDRRNIEHGVSSNCMEIDGKKNKKYTPNIKNETYELAVSMMKSEWMLQVPEDIDNWIAVLCPDGKRCCVVAHHNKTVVINKYGISINIFQSLFPYGCQLSNNFPSNHKRTVLDCLYSYKLKRFYVLDIIEWIGVPYTDFDADFRFFFIQSKLNEIPGIHEKSPSNFYPFELAPRMVASDLYSHLLENREFFPENVTLDGINFYYPKCLYTPGESPLVLWLKPFMIPDVLQRPVNDQLSLKPPDYVNIFEYSLKTKKKYKRIKKKKNVSNNENMEVDNLVEMEADPVTVVENDMCMEN